MYVYERNEHTHHDRCPLDGARRLSVRTASDVMVWQPAGFANVFDRSSCVPVTPEEMKRVGVELHLVEFHQQRLLACLYRNGVTREMLEDGYLVEVGGHVFPSLEAHFYRSLGVPLA